ncbi:CBM6-containing protein [Xenococcus sp. PCC 7305]|uniref:carbohydrate-binding protein n=1 Tax=Xenococcus sp. PCC 7305 TaxID=102125 RepID=UPI0002ACFA14|nr:carbohydrate-binding protein [Xenococcus sp. PCC 7305]ELS03362.1 CBM6-containing protein [Xenococcus sp. PCC 7305]
MTRFAYQFDYDLGTLDHQPVYRSQTLINDQYENDIYEFDIHDTKDLHLSLNNISHGDDADLYLYHDSNYNGVLDDSDIQVAYSINGGNSDDIIDYQAGAGTYFARVGYYSDGGDHQIDYDLDLVANSTSHTIRVEAEDYNSYYDTTHGNEGGVYRHDDVDIEHSNDYDGGYSVGWTQHGEFLTYDVHVPHEGYYQVVGRVASDLNRAHSLGVSANNGHSTEINFGDTGGWYSWQNANGGDIYLNAGHNTLTLDVNSSGFNVNYVELVS